MTVDLRPARSNFKNAQRYLVFEKEDRIGSFDMGNYTPFGPALLWFTTLPEPGRGKSGLVLGEFAKKIGHGNEFVVPDITHELTWIALAQLGLIEKAVNEKEISIVDHDILTNIPIAHILEKSGIVVHRLDMEKRNNAQLGDILLNLIQSPDNGPQYFNTLLFARA